MIHQMTETPFWPPPFFRWRARLFGHYVPSLHFLFLPRAPRRRWDRYSVQLLRRHTLLPIRILARAAAWSNSASITRQWLRKWVPFSASILRKIAPAAQNRLRFRGALLLTNIVPLLASLPFGAPPALAIAAPDPPARHALACRLLGPVWPKDWPQCADGSARNCTRRCALLSNPDLRSLGTFAPQPCRRALGREYRPTLAYGMPNARSLGCVARCIDPFALGSAFGCWYTSFILWLYILYFSRLPAAQASLLARSARLQYPAACSLQHGGAPDTCAASPCVMRHSAHQVASAHKCRSR
ncbi:hypothetical protein DFH06DRAFT_1296223 [Mycena polygramma]|nr:hypothetical protein DFH06DRAFT_1296223 [Mycena polygramma]